MSQFPDHRANEDIGPVYVREKGHLVLAGSHCAHIKTPPVRLFSKSFSVELRVNQGDTCKPKEKPFIFTYTEQGSLRYSAKPLFTLALDLIADNIQHVDSLLGFPEQVAERLFTAADARQQFCHPQTGLVALRKFTEAYEDMMLSSLCLRGKYLLVSEKLEEIKSFRGLHSLDLSCCKLGDEHELLRHLSSEAMDSLRELYLKDNCLSDIGVRKMTAPVRVLQRGLGNLSLLDMSCNPEITETGVTFLLVFKQLRYLDISDAGVQDPAETCKKIQTRTGLLHSKKPLTQFDHEDCKTQGWAEQLFCQWDQLVVSAIKSKKIPASRTAAQQFYGKDKVNRDDAEMPILNDSPAATTKHLQFYRPEGVKNPAPAVSYSGHYPVKRAKEEKHLEDTASSQPAKKSRVTLTTEDWDLLNSY
ncbi:leucine-rich repeat-containing protein 42 [Bufo gargarizans]|uniref:leucine-rich repeat-containing protein 42 n=1 Tax=Bufo gargarizans TaxID=30331 RepID=UPI001CF2BEF3|nr:leucine-rich repeat-containing protein 42 [Bufo gargarizans]XP_044156369.1 leucine-rich repeat-containing protein 42 [Bufo gargarizans]